MAGTMLGKVWLFSFDSKQVEMLTAFSDEGVRGLYLDEEYSYATLSEGCRGWRRTRPHAQQLKETNFRNLDRKNTQSVKHVLQRGPWACVLFPVASTVVNVAKQPQEHHHRAFKLFDVGSSAEVAPCDFDGESLVVVDRSDRTQGGFSDACGCASACGCGQELPDRPPVFRLVQLERNEQTEIDNLPKASSVTLIRLWGPDCLAYAVGSTLFLYDWREKALRRPPLSGHRAEIVAVDAHSPEIIATLSSDASVKLWKGATGECVQTLFVPGASFFLGYPYCLYVQGRRVLVSADEGVILLELDAGHSEV